MNAELIINDFKRNKISKEDAKSQLFELVIDNEISNDDFLRITHDMDSEAIEYDKKVTNLRELQKQLLQAIPAQYRHLKDSGMLELLSSGVISDEVYKNFRRLEYVKKQLKDITSPQNQAGVKPNAIKFVDYNEKGTPLKTWNNTYELLKHHGFDVKYNEFVRDVYIYDKEQLYSEVDMESYITEIQAWALRGGYELSDSTLTSHILHISKLKENRVNPVETYLLKCRIAWDGKSRIHKLVDMLITDDSDIDPNLKFELVKTWLVGCAKLPSNDLKNPIGAEGLLVLQGKQGIGKTSFSELIIPKELKDYYDEGVQLNVSDKDSKIEATSRWICELGELDGTLKKEQANLKAFFTKKTDTIRRPYGTKAITSPRLTSFIGTVNNKEFLRDETGDRRYWVIPIKGVKYNDLVLFNESDELDQLWGELKHIADTYPNSHKLDAHIKQLLNESNTEHRVITDPERRLTTSFDWEADKEEWKALTVAEIMDIANLTQSRGISAMLESLGSTDKSRKTINGKKHTVYLMPPVKSTYNL